MYSVCRKLYSLSIINILMFALPVLLFCSPICAVERNELRVKAGLDYFPSLLAADLDLAEKKDRDGLITLVLVYSEDIAGAKKMAGVLQAIKKIRNILIRVEVTDNYSMDQFRDRTVAGIFLTQQIGEGLQELINYADSRGIILFSPFKGDVERGVLGGLRIGDRVLPYINLSAMKSSGIRIKKFFIGVSETYEQ